MLRWTGEPISSTDFEDSVAQYPGTFYWDFHRADLHRRLLERAVELVAKVRCNAKVVDVKIDGTKKQEEATVCLVGGEEISCDLVVGTDGINSHLRELLLGHPDPPKLTGDLAYRLLLSTSDMIKDSTLAPLVKDPQVNYWLGPDKHAVSYVRRGGQLFNMVLIAPDDIPADGASTLKGNVAEMRNLFEGWDPRIEKLFGLCKILSKRRLCIQEPMGHWSHESGAWTMLGDAVHAAPPYLASGAEMALEDAAVLGECLSRITSTSAASKQNALRVYEQCRKSRTEMIVQRGNIQQRLYHLHDGPEQEDRDGKMRMAPTPPGEALAWRDPAFAPGLLGYEFVRYVDEYWASGQRMPESGESCIS